MIADLDLFTTLLQHDATELKISEHQIKVMEHFLSCSEYDRFLLLNDAYHQLQSYNIFSGLNFTDISDPQQFEVLKMQLWDTAQNYGFNCIAHTRIGAKPPHQFPRRKVSQEEAFANILTGYEVLADFVYKTRDRMEYYEGSIHIYGSMIFGDYRHLDADVLLNLNQHVPRKHLTFFDRVLEQNWINKSGTHIDSVSPIHSFVINKMALQQANYLTEHDLFTIYDNLDVLLTSVPIYQASGLNLQRTLEQAWELLLSRPLAGALAYCSLTTSIYSDRIPRRILYQQLQD